MSFTDRLAHAWNAFVGGNQRPLMRQYAPDVSSGSGWAPSSLARGTPSFMADKNIIENIVTRMSIDVSLLDFIHARVDENDTYLGDIKSGLNECMQIEANIDQTGRSFIQDLTLTILNDGVACVVPVDTSISPRESGGYDIQSMRVGRIKEWLPKHVVVELYNENVGIRQELTLDKSFVAIIANPLYGIMNEHNSTLQRLIRKLNQLDSIDNDIANKKLDLIVQVPYVVKHESRQKMAEKKRADIEFQLSSSQYGVAWIDAADRITQLNRPVENNMLPTVTYLTEQLYSYLGITKGLLEGSASEQEFLNYYNRTIEPIAEAIVDEFKRKFLTKTARTQGQSVIFTRKPFKLVPMRDLADVIDKFSRNEVTTSNEARAMIGLKPSEEPGADELRNANLPREYTDYADQPTEVYDDDGGDEYE